MGAKNSDSLPCIGASAFLKSVDFGAFAVNVKTIAPIQRLYQSGHAIWWHMASMTVGIFLESYDLTGKRIYPVSQSASMMNGQKTEERTKKSNISGNGLQWLLV